MSRRFLLEHERLLCVGGPLHGLPVSIIRGADIYMHQEPTRVAVDSYSGNPVDAYLPGPYRTVTYRRLQLLANAGRAFCDVLSPDDPPSVGQLPAIAAAGVALALSGGVTRSETFADAARRLTHSMQVAAREMRQLARHADRLGSPRGTPLYSPDGWSQENEADLCWRCDATSSTTDVGLCDVCLDDLRDAA